MGPLERILTPRDDAHERRILGILFLVMLAAFWPTLATFYGTWARSYQEHGFFVAGLTGWLLWQYRDRLRRWPGEEMPALLPVAALLSLGWLHPRAGFTVGGISGQSLSVGLGLLAGPWRLDLAVLNRGTFVPGDAKGIALAAGSSLEF